MVDHGEGEGSPARIPRWLDQSTAFAWRLLVLAAAIYVTAIMLDRLLVVVVPLVVAAMLTTVLAPPARWLRDHGWPPALATWAVFLLAFLVAAGLIAWLIPSFGSQFDSLQKSADSGINEIKHWLVAGPLQLGKHQVNHDIDQLGNELSSRAGGLALQGATLLLELLVGLLLSLVTCFFFIKDGERMTE